MISHTKRTIWGFREEERPCGKSGLTLSSPDRKLPEGTLAIKVETHPWFLIIWEPLPIETPEKNVKAYCCYIRTIIFYHDPYKLSVDGESFVDYGQIEHVLKCDDYVGFREESFKVGIGTCLKINGKWWMRYWARR